MSRVDPLLAIETKSGHAGRLGGASICAADSQRETTADEINPPSAKNKIEEIGRDSETILYAEDDARLSGLMRRLLK